MKAIVLIDVPDNQVKGIEYPFRNMYGNVTLDYGDKVIYLNGEIKERELFVNKEWLREKISEHFSNPYCAKTDIGNVMYEKEIMELIDRV